MTTSTNTTTSTFPVEQPYRAPLALIQDVEMMKSLSHPYRRAQQMNQPKIMPSMLREAMETLSNNGFGILSHMMNENLEELAAPDNMTLFALDDDTISSGSYAYVSSIRFHTVPNKLLTMADLEKLAAGTTLPTLQRGEVLVVTTGGKINDVSVKVPNVFRNLGIAVHSVYMPFPRIHSSSP